MSQLFVDNIKNRTGGAVGFPTGVVVTGVATFNNQVSIAGTLSYEDVTNVDSTGIITAKSGVKVTGGEILVGSGFSVGQAGVATASGIRVGSGITIDSASGIITAKSGLQLGSAGAGGTFTSAGYGQLEGGLVVSGVTTSTSAIVGSAVTINSTGINATGVITATSFSGDGSELTGVSAGLAASTVTLQTWLFGGG